VEPAAFFRRRFVFRLVRAILLRPFVAGFTKANISPGFVLRLFFRRTDPVALFRRFLAGLKTTFVFPDGLRFFRRRGFITVDPYPEMTFRAGFRLRRLRGFITVDPYPVMTRPGGFRLRAAALLFFVRASRTAPFAR
jgi:hypothetical protein